MTDKNKQSETMTTVTIKIDTKCDDAMVKSLRVEQGKMLTEMFISSELFVGVNGEGTYRKFSDAVSKAKNSKKDTVTISKKLYDAVKNDTIVSLTIVN